MREEKDEKVKSEISNPQSEGPQSEAPKLEPRNSDLKVLFIEDDEKDYVFTRDLLREASGGPYHLEWATTCDVGLEAMKRRHYDVCLVDYRLGKRDGLSLLREAVEQGCEAPFILLTGSDDESIAVKAMQEGAQDCLVKKQIDSRLLVRSIRHAIERHRLRKELEQSQKHQIQLKDQFFSHISHEIRSPVTAIYQFVTIILDGLAGDLNDEQREYLEIVLKNIRQLQTMIGDLLEVTRADTGKLALDLRCVSLVESITETLGMLMTAAAVKGIHLSADVPDRLPPVYADPSRVKQVLINLIENGIKFAPENGHIMVRARAFELDQFVCVAVADSGSGMQPEIGKKIFDRLYQQSDDLEAGRKGLGLGLYICRELVTRHGGKIWVESQPGQGSVFYFTLPIFSLAKLLYPIITKDDHLKDTIALITVRLSAVARASSIRLTETARRDAWQALQRCILPDKNILLPRMANGEESELFYVVDCNGQGGAETAAQRIRERLDQCKELQNPFTGVTVSTTRIEPPSANKGISLEQRVNEISNRILELMNTSVSDRAEEAKRDLFRVMSQKVRTPLSVVMGYAGILRDKLLGELNPEQESALDKVMDHTYDLVGVINNILEVQRIETRAIKVESHEVHVASLLDQLRSANEAPRTKAIAIDWDYPSKLPVVMTDGNKLRAILQNLINNAIKFTEKGTVTVSAGIKQGGRRKAKGRKQQAGVNEHPTCVEFKVTDTGIGMPNDAVPAIFEKFCCLEPSGADPLEGMGLGLYIVNTFTEMLGGKVDVESELGKGSVFKVTIPLRIEN